MFAELSPQVRKRPLGISIIAIFLGLYGICIMVPVFALILMKLGGGHVSFNIVVDLFGVTNLLLAWGLWKYVLWVSWGTIILQVLTLGYIWAPSTPFINDKITASIVPICILVYFVLSRNQIFLRRHDLIDEIHQ